MTDFGFLDNMQINSDDLAELTLGSVMLPNGKNPTFTGRLAGEQNKGYATALAQKGLKNSKMNRGAAINASMALAQAKKNRDEDRELFAEHVITGWNDVCDADGVDVAFSKDVCKQFFRKLPDDIFDQVRAYFGDTSNFRDIPSIEDAEDLGKN